MNITHVDKLHTKTFRAGKAEHTSPQRVFWLKLVVCLCCISFTAVIASASSAAQLPIDSVAIDPVNTVPIHIVANAEAAEHSEGVTLRFHELLERSLQGQRLQLARSRLTIAERNFAVATAGFSASLSSGYTRSWGESIRSGEQGQQRQDIGSSRIEPIRLDISLDPIIPSGARHESLQRARLDMLRARSSFIDERAEAILAAVSAFVELRRLDARLAEQQADVALRSLERDAIKQGIADGSRNERELLAADIALSREQSDLAQQERERLQALANLSLELGVAVQQVQGALPNTTMPLLHEDITLYIHARTDVQRARWMQEEAALSLGRTQREYAPRGSLSLGYNRSEGSDSLGLSLNLDSDSFQPRLSASYTFDAREIPEGEQSLSNRVDLSLGVSIPLSPARPAALEAAQLALEQSRLSLEQSLELAAIDIRNQQRAIDAAQHSLELVRQAVLQAQTQAQQEQERFRLGLVTLLELRRAERDVLSAEASYLSAQQALITAQLRLAQALTIDPLELF